MNTPKIRFKGFTDDWEQRKLGEVVGIYDGVHQTPQYQDSGIMFLSVENITTLKSEKYISEEAFERDYKVYPEKGDILMTRIGDVGTTNVVQTKEKVAFYVSLALLKPKEINSYFLSNAMKTSVFQKGLRERTLVTAIPQKINKDEIGRVNVFITNNAEEQKKIGDYFTALDHLITLHQRKCDETKQLKKFMLQKMFPKNGEKNPKIRFEGFTDDWEQRKLGEIYGSIGNAFVGTATPYYVDQGHFYLESNNVKDGQINHNSEIFINDEFYEKQRDKWLHAGDMVMVQSGHVGHAAVIPKELDNTAAHALIMFRNAKEKIEPYFLNYEYQTDKTKKKIENITTGNTIKHILASDMQEFEVDIPKYEEQKIIAGYFRTIDHLITLHQRKCEKLKELKKYMLHNMFV